jgi:hypothetical protein
MLIIILTTTIIIIQRINRCFVLLESRFNSTNNFRAYRAKTLYGLAQNNASRIMLRDKVLHYINE